MVDLFLNPRALMLEKKHLLECTKPLTQGIQIIMAFFALNELC